MNWFKARATGSGLLWLFGLIQLCMGNTAMWAPAMRRDTHASCALCGGAERRSSCRLQGLFLHHSWRPGLARAHTQLIPYTICQQLAFLCGETPLQTRGYFGLVAWSSCCWRAYLAMLLIHWQHWQVLLMTWFFSSLALFVAEEELHIWLTNVGVLLGFFFS